MSFTSKLMRFSCMRGDGVSDPSQNFVSRNAVVSAEEQLANTNQPDPSTQITITSPTSHCDSEAFNNILNAQTFSRNSAGRLSFGKFEVRKTLGVGAQAKVLLAKDSEKNDFVALKVIDKSSISERNQKQINNEILAMRTIHHPNVLNLREVYDNISVPSSRSSVVKTAIVLVLDLCTGGELFDFMLCTGGFPEDVARTYFTQILGAISTCHAAGIFHRDIKPQNILLDSDYQVKIADFGLSTLHTAETDICFTYCGTMSYMAPEILAGEAYSGAKADSWSLGILLFFILAGNPPLRSATTDDWWYKAILNRRMERFWHAHERLSPSFPRTAQAILSRLLVANPIDRCSVKEVLDDPWLDGPVLTPEQLKKTMEQRRSTFMAAKEAQDLQKLRECQENIARQGAGGMFDTFRTELEYSTHKQSTHQPPHLNTWKNPEDVICAYGDSFSEHPDGFYLNKKAGIQVLQRLYSVCIEAGASNVQEHEQWTLRVTFDGKLNKKTVENFQGPVDVELALYTAKKDMMDVTFVRISQPQSNNTKVGNAILNIICRIALRKSSVG